jgi:Heterokaryon incompatibility protein (HET)
VLNRQVNNPNNRRTNSQPRYGPLRYSFSRHLSGWDVVFSTTEALVMTIHLFPASLIARPSTHGARHWEADCASQSRQNDSHALIASLDGGERALNVSSTSDSFPFAICRNWIRDCLDGHIGCGESRGVNWSPKRLLEMKNGRLKLLITKDEEPVGQYATLSHCWGEGTGFMKLSADNIQDSEEEIDPLSLPATFRDAIDIVRRLGFKYIWIHSLCIL